MRSHNGTTSTNTDGFRRIEVFTGVDPQAWLADVLARLPDHPAKAIAELLPWSWAAARPTVTEAAA